MTDYVTVKKLGEVDVGNYVHLFQSLDESDWMYWEDRYGMKAKSHENVLTLPLAMVSNPDIQSKDMSYPSSPTELFEKYYDPVFFGELTTLLNNTLGDGYFINITFDLLKGQSEIVKHVDMFPTIAYNNRVHVPIITNESVSFYNEPDYVWMDEGEVYLIDNTLPHSVINGGSDRIHLVVDWHVIRRDI